jgi:hypothetical protein
MPFVPNGCDCFGCCDIRTEANPGQAQWVYIGSFDETQSGSKTGTCDMEAAKAGNTQACRPCTPLENCLAECGRCQLCLGKTVDDLPADCFEAPPEERCTLGRQPCGLPGDDPCPAHHFCLTGCCTWAG